MERSTLNKTFLNCFRPHFPQDEDMNKYRTAGSSHRTIRRFVKAILFHTTLVKKIRSRKSIKKSYASESTTLPSNQAPQSAANPPRKELHRDSSLHRLFSRNSSIISSSSFSSSSWRGIQYTEYDEKNEPSPRKISLGKSEGVKFCVCFFIICLFTLTCWGKLCTVFFTSTLLLLVPSRVNRFNLVGHSHDSSRKMYLEER